MSKIDSERPQNIPHFDTLQDYQLWASTNWLYEQGSDKAQLHARGKIAEETQELTDALSSGEPEEVLSEIGDVLWTATANAHNAGITIEESFRYTFSPESFSDDPISVNQIDEMAVDFTSDQPIEETITRLKYLAGRLGKAAKQYHNLSPLVDANAAAETFADAWILLKAARAKQSLTEIVLIASSLAQNHCGSTLQEAMMSNRRKLTARINTGLPITSLPVQAETHS
jgi:NTP pyrophosphatase (non-canonical NTP hydrolase)